jgi:hypothetical protein
MKTKITRSKISIPGVPSKVMQGFSTTNILKRFGVPTAIIGAALALVMYGQVSVQAQSAPSVEPPPNQDAQTSPPDTPGQPPDTQLAIPMHVEGFDAKVAAENGYEIRTLPDGKQYSVPQNTQQGLAVPDDAASTNNAVKGNCGESYLYFYAKGGLKGEVTTGFKVNRPAISYSWRVEVTDRAGVGTLNWDGGLAFRETWEGKRTTKGASGSAVAVVNPADSYALLSNGAICVSGGPSDSIYYY